MTKQIDIYSYNEGIEAASSFLEHRANSFLIDTDSNEHSRILARIYRIEARDLRLQKLKEPKL